MKLPAQLKQSIAVRHKMMNWNTQKHVFKNVVQTHR